MKLFKRYKAVTYLPNLYTLLQYLLMEPFRIEDTLFFIQKSFPVSVGIRLPEADFLREDYGFQRVVSAIKIYWLILRNRDLPLYLGGNLFFTHVFLRYSKNAVYLEDGAATYNMPYYKKERLIRTKRKDWISGILYGDISPWYGLADNVRKIYLTGILPIPDIIAHKGELINLKQLWLRKTKEQQEKIARLFLSADSARELTKREYSILLLTQPFSEYSKHGFSEKDKIEVYRKLVSGYNESDLVIKKHPAEVTDYGKYFPKASIIDLSCPFELLVLLGLRAQKLISVDSTAIYGFDEFQEKIISGYDVTPALKEEALMRGII